MLPPPRKPPPPSGLRRLLCARIDNASSGFVGCLWAAAVAVAICGGLVCGVVMLFAFAIRAFSGAY